MRSTNIHEPEAPVVPTGTPGSLLVRFRDAVKLIENDKRRHLPHDQASHGVSNENDWCLGKSL